MRALILLTLLLTFETQAKFKVTILAKTEPEIKKVNIVKKDPVTPPKALKARPLNLTTNLAQDKPKQTSPEPINAVAAKPVASNKPEMSEKQVVQEPVKPKKIFKIEEGMTLGLLVQELSRVEGIKLETRFSQDWLKNIIFSKDADLGPDIGTAMNRLVSMLNKNQSLKDRNIRFYFTLSKNLLEFENV